MVMPKVKKLIETPSFYHRKVAKSGGSRYLTVSKILPPDWLIVKVEVLKFEGKECLLRITKLA